MASFTPSFSLPFSGETEFKLQDARMLPDDQTILRDIYRQAMNETDAVRLLEIFLELDYAAQRDQRANHLVTISETRRIGAEG